MQPGENGQGTLKRENYLTKIKETAETEKAPKKTESMHFNWSSIAKQENPEDFYLNPADQVDAGALI